MPQKKILLVDDDAEDRFIIADALETEANSSILLYAENGAEAISVLEHIGQSAELPCLIVLDLNMPKMNGTETLQYLKSSTGFKHIPVIIYSTSENPLEKERCIRLGALDYITKPSSMAEWKLVTKLFLSFCQ